jgi:HNH endonuclease
MTVPTPFTYSPEPHQRKHGPAGYQNYQDYKPWLRDEFTFRCVYCLERELWYPDRYASFSADHVEPQKDAPLRVCDYTNLVYACTRCNSYKRRVRLIDPTVVAFGMHLQVDEKTSVIHAIQVDGKPSRDGELIIRLLHLNEDPALSNRRQKIEILALKQEFPTNEKVHRLFLQTFGYPDELPDLRGRQPPDGNRREGSERGCYRALRDARRLPDTY